MSRVCFILDKDAEGIIHVYLEVARNGDDLLFSDFDCFFYGVIHPNFDDYNHKRKTDRARVGCGVMDAVVDEVESGETELDEAGDVIRCESSAR